ncbi:MAG: glycosyltransferase family 87 protein [Chloroflexota bacterium]
MQRWAAPLALGLATGGLLVLGLATWSWIGRSPSWAYDFHAYWEAALRLVSTGSPYTVETLAGPFRLAPPFRLGPDELFMYSPVLALLLVPLTAFGESVAVVFWLALRVAALAMTCSLMPIPRRLRLAVFGVAALSVPVLRDLELGNVSLIVTLLAVVIWRWLDRPVAGIALALSLTVRPTMVLIGAWWLLRGLWRPIAWSAGAGVVVVLASLLWLRSEAWLQYPTVLGHVRDVMGVPNNVDLGSAVLLVGGPPWLAQIALYGGYLIALGAVLLSLRRDRELSYVVTLMATLLLSPLLWDHYLTNLLVPAAFLAARGRWWGLALPLLCWTPTLLVALVPTTKPFAEALLAPIAIAGLLLPFLAPDAGERAGFFGQRLGRGRQRQVVTRPQT